MQVYSDKSMCNGCRACEQVCPAGCITMETDEEGFWYPLIDKTRCINCGKCHTVCLEIGKIKKTAKSIVYAVRNRDLTVREKSTSGGVFWEVACYVLNNGGSVFGAIFTSDFLVQHVGTNDTMVVKKMRGAKYVQSDTLHTFSEAKELLEQGSLVLYSGTPCQIAGLKSYLGKEYSNLLCISIICHGVPSPMIWKKYLEYHHFFNEAPYINIQHRDKENAGWRKANTVLESGKKIIKEVYTENIYIKGFLQNLYLRPSCFSCRTKGIDAGADIILGDYWGIEKYHPQIDDNMGVSAVIICTEKGKKVFNGLLERFDIIESDMNNIECNNSALIKSVPWNSKRKEFFEELLSTNNIEQSILHNLRQVLDKNTRERYLYPIVLKYLENKVKGYEIGTFLEARGYKSIVLYAVTALTELVALDLQNSSSNVQLNYICDKNAGSFTKGVYGKKVIAIKELVEKCQRKEVDCVIICNPFFENDIFRDLQTRGCEEGQLMSINSIIFGFGEC